MLCWTVHLKRLTEISFDAAIAYDAAVEVNRKVYCFRGDFVKSNRRTEVHVFNPVSLCWIKLPPETTGRAQLCGGCAWGEPQRPLVVHPMRTLRTAVLIDPFIYIWGGVTDTGHCSKVLYAFDVNAHRMLTPKISGTAPEGRYGHSACVFRKAMFIYGGCNNLSRCTRDMYKLDTITMVWSLVNTRGTSPPASAWHSVSIIGTKMYVFGGRGDKVEVFNTIRVFDTETNRWLIMPSAQLLPEPRNSHSAFSYNGELYIFGDRKLKQGLNYLWKFSPSTFTWNEVQSKGNVPCLSTRQTCCIVGDRIILFGGYTSNGTVNDDLYILDLSPSLKTLCKLAVIQYGLEQSELPYNIRWELASMKTNSH